MLGRNGDPLSNGGYTADYVYSNFSLGNTADQIQLAGSANDVLRLDYEAGFVGAGTSAELIGLPDNYQLTNALNVYGLGDIGTPGAAGSYAPGPNPVPLPAALWLFGSGLLGMLGMARKRAGHTEK